MMAGTKIIFLLTILLAPQAFPAYKLKYFNNILTNVGSKACAACMIYMDLYKRYEQLNKHYPRMKFTINHNLTTGTIVLFLGFLRRLNSGVTFHYVGLCHESVMGCHDGQKPTCARPSARLRTRLKTQLAITKTWLVLLHLHLNRQGGPTILCT